MKTAQFTNFTNQEFIGYWDGKAKTFPSGSSLYMPDYLAKHFAKHLTNQELLRTKVDGSLVYAGGDKMTSPKRPEDVPMFMELFDKAYTEGGVDELGDKQDDIDALIGAANKNREKKGGQPKKTVTPKATKQPKAKTGKQDPRKPQVVLPPDFNEDEDNDEGSFGGKPIENKPAGTSAV